MNNFIKTKKNFIYATLSQIITIVMGIIIPRLTIVGYGSEVNGLLTSVAQFIAYLGLFEAGIQSVAKQSLYKNIAENNKKEINSILSAVDKNYRRIGIFYLIALIATALFFVVFTKTRIKWYTIFFVVIFSGLGNVIVFFFQGKYKILLEADGKNYIITNLQTIISLLTYVFKIVLLLFKCDVAIVLSVTFFISLIQTFYMFIYVKKRYTWINVNEDANFHALDQSKDVLVHQVASLIFNNTDVLLLTIFCDLKTVSVYSLYKLIIGFIVTIVNIPLGSCSFFMGQTYNTNIRKYIYFHDSIEVGYATLVFSLFSVTNCLILPFIKIYTKSVIDVNYIDKYVAILFIIMELLNLMRMPTLNTINYSGHFKNTKYQTIIEMLINLIVSFIGVITIGIYGVLIGSIVALLYRSFEVVIYTNNVLLHRSCKKTFTVYLVNFLLLIVISVILKNINFSINTLLEFVLIGFIITPIVVLVFIILNYLLFKKDVSFLFVNLKTIIKK